MERPYRGKFADAKAGGGLKDLPQCERCGRPVKVSSDDYLTDEVLCTHCASDARSVDDLEEEFI